MYLWWQSTARHALLSAGALVGQHHWIGATLLRTRVWLCVGDLASKLVQNTPLCTVHSAPSMVQARLHLQTSLRTAWVCGSAEAAKGQALTFR